MRSESAGLRKLHAAVDEGTLLSSASRPPAAVYRRENDVWESRDAQRRHLLQASRHTTVCIYTVGFERF